MSLKYDDIFNALLSLKDEKGSNVIPESAATISNAIIDIKNNKFVDCFFLFGFPTPWDNISKFYPAFGKITFDFEGKKLINSNNRQLYDKFEVKGALKYPDTYPIEYEEELSDKEMDKIYNQYKRTYIQIRKFAFKDKVNKKELEILQKYKDSFNMITPKDMKQFYYALSPEFFKWMERQLKEK